jgi:hypothetical protein
LFYNGRSDQGACAAGGAHVARGRNFVLAHDIPATANAQTSWRFCQKCYALFFAGDPNQGVCAKDAKAHLFLGDVFVLSHDIPITANSQASWKFCKNCRVMFFDGPSRPGGGVCKATGKAHSAQGDHFVLYFVVELNPAVHSITGDANEFTVAGGGFLPNDQLTFKCLVIGTGSGASEGFSVVSPAAPDGSFSCNILPPEAGPELVAGANLSVTVQDEFNDFASAGCIVDDTGRIVKFQSFPGSVGVRLKFADPAQ